uniref:Uncharacterized protein n=1 Tax=Cucumis melo TaxID=3656 RepID=A0A9I9EJQ1_CUCME
MELLPGRVFVCVDVTPQQIGFFHFIVLRVIMEISNLFEKFDYLDLEPWDPCTKGKFFWTRVLVYPSRRPSPKTRGSFTCKPDRQRLRLATRTTRVRTRTAPVSKPSRIRVVAEPLLSVPRLSAPCPRKPRTN